MRSKFTALIVTSGFATLLAMAGCVAKPSTSVSGGGSALAAKTPPEATTAIPGLDGTNVTVSQYKGKVVLVNFWATWCKPCQTEIPWLIEFNDKYKAQGLVILGVAVDDDGKKVVEPYVTNRRFDVNGQSKAMDYQILIGNDAISDKFGGLLGLPTSILYGRDGRKVKTIIGIADYHDLAAALEKQL